MKTFGQIAYEGYRNSTGGKSLVSGQPIPEWSDLSIEIKSAWDAAGIAVVGFLVDQQSQPLNSQPKPPSTAS